MRVSLLLTTAALGSALAAQSPLTTTFNSSTFLSSANGVVVYFDLNVRTGVQIHQMDVNFFGNAGTAVTIDVWVRNGTHVGNTTSANGWTLAGSSNPGTAMGRDVPSPMTFATPITLQPGLWGIAVQHQGAGAAYTAGTSVGNVFASTAEMDFLEGGSANPPIFSGIQNSPRVMNCSIHYQPLGGFASSTPFGTGCGGMAVYSSYYENFPASTFDLGGAPGAEFVLSHMYTGSGYVVVQGTSAWFNPTSPNLNLGATALSAALPLGFTFTLPSGAQTSNIWVCSDGYIWLTSAGRADFTPSVTELLAEGERLAPCWISLDPTAGGSIHFDTDPANGVAYVTWLQVPETVSGATITMQVAIHATGDVEYRYGPETLGTSSTTFALVGLSPGNNALDPGNTDISSSLPLFLGPDQVVPDMNLSSDRPVEGTTMNVNITEMPANTVVGALILSTRQLVPGIQPIPGLGNCFQHVVLTDALYFTPTANSHTLSVPVPTGILTGTTFQVQTITLSPGVNPAGVASTNGLSWLVDVN